MPLPKPTELLKQKAREAHDYPTLIVDDREHRIHTPIIDALELAGVPVQVQRMDFGDYAFTGSYNTRLDRPATVGIELSNVSDVVGKLNNDRLAFQLSGMLITYDISILMITSPIQISNDGYVILPRMPKACEYSRLMDVLGAAQAHGVIVTYCAGSEDAPARLLQTIRYWYKDEGTHKYFRPRDAIREVTMPVGEAVDKRVSTLMTLPGIGEQRAVDALKTFGSVYNIVIAPEAALAQIPGWGVLTAKKVSAFLRDPIQFPTITEENTK